MTGIYFLILKKLTEKRGIEKQQFKKEEKKNPTYAKNESNEVTK